MRIKRIKIELENVIIAEPNCIEEIITLQREPNKEWKAISSIHGERGFFPGEINIINRIQNYIIAKLDL